MVTCKREATCSKVDTDNVSVKDTPILRLVKGIEEQAKEKQSFNREEWRCQKVKGGRATRVQVSVSNIRCQVVQGGGWNVGLDIVRPSVGAGCRNNSVPQTQLRVQMCSVDPKSTRACIGGPPTALGGGVFEAQSQLMIPSGIALIESPTMFPELLGEGRKGKIQRTQLHETDDCARRLGKPKISLVRSVVRVGLCFLPWKEFNDEDFTIKG
ncbi:hypothetical protein TIFTF001_007396 [Ficus carica]|uniref:Uncharacterized protein n=1 Tax=Ficus carica TaxID=3494 RepID=A0AA88A6I8_FICCA|nr:hypothetical protein TIFTF001_007396 [Ficus carica]